MLITRMSQRLFNIMEYIVNMLCELSPVADGLRLAPVYGELTFTQLRAVDKGHDNVISTGIGRGQRSGLRFSRGSGVFKSVMLVTIEVDHGVIFENDRIKADRPRFLIKKFGEIALGDRWSGVLRIKGNSLIIGEDQGRFAGTENGGQFSEIPKDRVIEIDVSP